MADNFEGRYVPIAVVLAPEKAFGPSVTPHEFEVSGR
jgi:hypothetical protein